jgi:hypothetical protein
VYLWASDFRTSITDMRYARFVKLLEENVRESKKVICRVLRKPKRHMVLLVNQHDSLWDREPFEFVAEFREGQFFKRPAVFLNGVRAISQIEEPRFYADGSLRRARILLCPRLRPGEVSRLSLQETDEEIAHRMCRTEHERFETEEVVLRVIGAKGAAIKELMFKGVSGESLVGTLPHGYFDDISFAADFFSGHTIVSGPFRKLITDLNAATIEVPRRFDAFPLRLPVRCGVTLGIGALVKTYRIYRDRPRLDIDFRFRVKSLKNLCFRLGMVTANPKAFDRRTLEYCTVNGGCGVEEFMLRGKIVKHQEQVSAAVSSKHCLGATERWASIGDKDKGLAIIARNGPFAAVPMVHYQEIDGQYFLRVYSSIGETDDTARSLWRGELSVGFSYIGYKGFAVQISRLADSIRRGLLIK